MGPSDCLIFLASPLKKEASFDHQMAQQILSKVISFIGMCLYYFTKRLLQPRNDIQVCGQVLATSFQH